MLRLAAALYDNHAGISILNREWSQVGIKIQLLGIGIILAGIALSTNDIISFSLGIVGAVLCIAGVFVKKN